jgi:hypothetical protein
MRTGTTQPKPSPPLLATLAVLPWSCHALDMLPLTSAPGASILDPTRIACRCCARAWSWERGCAASWAARSISERIMHVERSAMCMDVERKRHPCGRRDPDPGDRLDSRVRGNDYDAASAVC